MRDIGLEAAAELGERLLLVAEQRHVRWRAVLLGIARHESGLVVAAPGKVDEIVGRARGAGPDRNDREGQPRPCKATVEVSARLPIAEDHERLPLVSLCRDRRE